MGNRRKKVTAKSVTLLVGIFTDGDRGGKKGT